MPLIFLAHLVLHQFSHENFLAHRKLNDCHNLLSCEILQNLLQIQ